MASDLKIRFSSNFLLSFWWMQVCLATLRTHKFFKRKKRKKESHSSKWKVSKKQVFQKKYYPIRDWNRQRLIRSKISFEIFWVEIFSETRRAWTCFFEYLELIFALFFLFFILNIQIKCSCLIGFYLKEWVLIWKIDVFGKGIKFFGWMNKPNHKIHKLFIRPKNLILFLLVLILRMPESQLAVSVFS